MCFIANTKSRRRQSKRKRYQQGTKGRDSSEHPQKNNEYVGISGTKWKTYSRLKHIKHGEKYINSKTCKCLFFAFHSFKNEWYCTWGQSEKRFNLEFSSYIFIKYR